MATTPKTSDQKRPPRTHGKKPKLRGEETTWHRPDYRIVEASMEMTAYFLTR
ncbi:pyrroloquinoline quinone precursor peptide PqqA [Streptosporangium sp. CA-135522]|uniref:pyrroloquinoline quinone precursor peptide PqqA n=1 Tax=Streptosporangium sp. CA-135522 TaxID=3240072 RepID=UPI003D8ADA2A